jgi:SNF2 family DNA or RNA helicase
LLELLGEAVDGGHRTLVFSQFTSMLDLIAPSLDEAGISWCRLDGSTKDRGAVVERFQSDPSISVFLISLKAGGVGLNLTGADTVIHFDPWWNPAVEAQATDRAHRIGQQNVVTSIKLIARDTVEERVLEMQAKKKTLSMELLDPDSFTELSTEIVGELIG